MSAVIWKYPLAVTDETIVRVPAEGTTDNNCAVLRAAEQDGMLCLWVIIKDETLPPLDCRVWIKGTGHPIDWDPTLAGGVNYLGTVPMTNGMVWHLFSPDIGTYR